MQDTDRVAPADVRPLTCVKAFLPVPLSWCIYSGVLVPLLRWISFQMHEMQISAGSHVSHWPGIEVTCILTGTIVECFHYFKFILLRIKIVKSSCVPNIFRFSTISECTPSYRPYASCCRRYASQLDRKQAAMLGGVCISNWLPLYWRIRSISSRPFRSAVSWIGSASTLPWWTRYLRQVAFSANLSTLICNLSQKIAATSQKLLQFILLCLCAVLINSVVTPYFILLTIPICGVYYVVQKFYRCSSR